MKSSSALAASMLLALLASACGGGKEGGSPAAGGGAPAQKSSAKPAVSKATDDIPSSNRTEFHVDRFRFGTTTDADGIVVAETDLIPPGTPPAISLYLRNAPAGVEVRMVWKDLGKGTPVEEQTMPAGDKGFAAFKAKNAFPEGAYKLEMFYREAGAKDWQNLGGHDFKVGNRK